MLIWICLITLYLIVQNFGYAALQVWLLRRRQPWPGWLGTAVFAWATLMTLTFLLELYSPISWKPFLRDDLYFPMAVGMVWNVLLLQVLFPTMLFVVLIVRIRSRGKKLQPLTANGISRRRFLYLVSYGAAPATALSMGVHGAASEYDLQVRQFDIPIRNLPPELEGFTIAHVSDLHSGIFVGPERLKIISDATNDLKADLVAVTGDVINREMGEFPAALAAIQRMESPYGTYLCEGNHDVAPGNGVLVSACLHAGLKMLYNNCVTVPVRGRNLQIGGLSWMRTFDMDTQPGMVGDLFVPHPPTDTRILLAHHPDLFDISQDADLVLSGHTHGGQIMFGDIGLGRIRFRYWSGRYQRDKTTMIVSNGCGDWFPCRIGAPAEIGLVRLTAAKPV
jgi:predicted MPP superfamily phosphohydrolase